MRRAHPVLNLALLLWATAIPVRGEEPHLEPRGPLHTRVFRLAEMGGDPRETFYFVPPSAAASERPPLVVALPGGVGDAASLVAEQPQLFAQAERHGFVVLVPSSTLSYGAVLPSGRSLRDVHEAYVLDAIAHAEERFGTDPERRFLMGFSAGGSGAWALALGHPDAFRGLALIGPAGSPEREALGTLRHLPVYLAQAADDKAIRRGENRRAVEDLRELGGTVRFEEPAHGSHGLQEYPVLRTAYDLFARLATEGR